MKSPEFLTSKGVELEKSLELFGDIETYNETVGDFIVSASGKINKLKEYLDAKDINNYEIYVHSLKSDAKYFGFSKLAEIAFDHETKSKAGDTYHIIENFGELENAVNNAIAVVKEYLSDDVKEEAAPAVKDKLAPSAAEEYTEKTILVVDDSNIIRNFVKRIFSESYQVGTAKDGKEAIDLINANKDNDKIVAILLDLNMPRVDGFEVLKYMEENSLFSTIPVSIISGDSSKETIDKAFQYPIIDMLGKPFNDVDVKRVVEKTLMYKEME